MSEFDQAPSRQVHPTVSHGPERNPRRLPPQIAGVAPPSASPRSGTDRSKINIALKTLLDPEARERFSQPYSGQSRRWP
jgi:hypothetical protein